MQSFSKYVAAVVIASSLLFSAPARGQDSEQQLLPEEHRCGGEIFQCVTVDGTDTLVVVDVNLAHLRGALEESEERVEALTTERNELRESRNGAWLLAGVGAVMTAILASVLAAAAAR